MKIEAQVRQSVVCGDKVLQHAMNEINPLLHMMMDQYDSQYHVMNADEVENLTNKMYDPFEFTFIWLIRSFDLPEFILKFVCLTT